jgi:hypothetical protein
MIFFNIQALEQLAKADNEKFLKIFRGIVVNKTLDTNVQKAKKGHSFMLEPNKLMLDRKTPDEFKIQYIKLAGRRDYSSYKLYKITSLDLSLFPDLKRDLIVSNPLLKINNNELYFKYEDKDN